MSVPAHIRHKRHSYNSFTEANMNVPAHIRHRYETAVERGRVFLDKYAPTWRFRVRLFTMADPVNCLICHVTGCSNYSAAKRAHEIEWENGSSYGFDIVHARPESDYDLLQELWTAVIIETPETT